MKFWAIAWRTAAARLVQALILATAYMIGFVHGWDGAKDVCLNLIL